MGGLAWELRGASREGDRATAEWSFSGTNEGSGPPAWKSIPPWFVFSELDKNIPVTALRFMA